MKLKIRRLSTSTIQSPNVREDRIVTGTHENLRNPAHRVAHHEILRETGVHTTGRKDLNCGSTPISKPKIYKIPIKIQILQ
jgi:hypothetical protein